MHPEAAGQHVQIHLRHAALSRGLAQQRMHHRAETGHPFQALRLQIGETHRHVGAKAEAKGGDAGVIDPRGLFQRPQGMLVKQAGVLGQLPFR